MYAEGKLMELEKIFNFCYPLEIKSELEKFTFFEGLSDKFSGLVQYHKYMNY